MFGGAFLIVWNDVDQPFEAEYRKWHRVEHMPERLSTPGFRLGRRYTALDDGVGKYLTIYEVEGLQVFASEAYRQRLAEPTPWTVAMSERMRNFVRRVCQTRSSRALAVGSCVATIRVSRIEPLHAEADGIDDVTQAIAGIEGVTGVHFGVVDGASTGLRRDAMQSSSAAEDFDLVAIIEAPSREDIEAGLADVRQALVNGMPGAQVDEPKLYGLSLLYRPG